MKKLFLFAVTAVMAFSCTKEIIESNGTAYLTSIDAVIEQMTDTKTSVDLVQGSANYGKVSWEAGDAFSVWNGTAAATFTYDTAKDKFFTDQSGFLASGNYKAVYPASIVTSWNADGSANVNIPATQVYSEDKVKDAPMFCSSTSAAFAFKNICGIAKFSMDGTASVKEIVFRASKAGVCGGAVINASGAWVIDSESEDNKTVTLDCAGSTLGSGSNYFLYLPAQLYAGGFEIDIEFTDGTRSLQSTTKDIPVAASSIDAMSLFTASSATFSGGKGTAEDPYLIATPADLTNLASFCNNAETAANYNGKFYRQTRDIDMGGVAGTVPIGCSEALAFAGSYDGCNHKIANVQIAPVGEGACGLFGYVTGESAVVRNLTIGGNLSTDNLFIGSVAGILNKGTVENCTFDGIVTSSMETGVWGPDEASYSYMAAAAGIIGIAYDATIKDCILNGTVKAGNLVGGIVSWTSGATISGCKIAASGKVDATTSVFKAGSTRTTTHFVGGIVGRARFNTTIENCTVDGAIGVYSGNYVGGITGHLTSGTVRGCTVSDEATISTKGNHSGGIVGALQPMDLAAGFTEVLVEDCVTKCHMSGGQNVGGIAGYSGCSGSKDYHYTIRNCKTYGDLNSMQYNCGGIAGFITCTGSCEIEDCVSYGDVNCTSYDAGGIVGYAVESTGTTTINRCAAYGSVSGVYSSGGIAGYIKCNDATCVINVVNCGFFGDRVRCTGNNGANGYSLCAGVCGWVQVTKGSVYLVNNVTRANTYDTVSKYTTYSTTNNTMGGLIGYNNGTTALNAEFVNSYSTTPKSGFVCDNKSYDVSAYSSLYGGVYGKISLTALAVVKNCWFNPSVPVGPSPEKVTNLDAATVCAYDTPEDLLNKLNAGVTAYNGKCSIALSSWVAGEDGMPIISGMSCSKPVNTSKRISVIGDSISTYRGFVANGYSCHYPTADGNLTSVNQTYWYRLAHDYMKDAVFDTNISFSGSTVTNTTYENMKARYGNKDEATMKSSYTWYKNSFSERFAAQGGCGKPDIILIHGGTNDWGHNADPLAPGLAIRNDASNDYGGAAPSDDAMNAIYAVADAAKTRAEVNALPDATFCEAYCKLLCQIKERYPACKVVCIIGDYLNSAIEQSTIKMADHYGAKVVNLFRVNGFNDLGGYSPSTLSNKGKQPNMPKHDYSGDISGCHPGSDAMEFIANKIYTELGAWLEE